ncbi:MAG: M23 family metallopeptidase [Trueperaceae bacterium]|nr:M23 family metallopeptidase [Trueperaceae bacterium]
MSTLRGFAASLALLVLLGFATAQGATITETSWPTPVCEAGAETAGQTATNHRPRQLDQVGPIAPLLLLMPVEGALVADVHPSFGDPRGGGTRTHEGIDIMAPRGTPVRPAAPGYVTRVNPDAISVTIIGNGGIRYFYTHFDALPDGLIEGQWASTDTIIGFVGNTGNAAATAPHLHFGVYYGGLGDWCGWIPVDPLPWLVDR